MADKLFFGPNGHHCEKSERKYPNGHRDVKRKLAFMSKKIGDLQHQRKILYKNSAKVKRIIHNQVNQIVKCLRARERSLWADVDEAYIAEDEYISEELSVLQSVHARCQALFENVSDNKKAIELDKIYSILSEAKVGEKQDVKALEFMSEFEAIKNMANCFGHLEGDFVKKDEFVFVNKKENNSSDPVYQEFHSKGTSADQDNRFSDKQKKLLKQLKFNEILNRKVDMNKINLDVVKPWIAQRITDMLGGIEDDVVIEFVFNQLEAEKYPDARIMHLNLTGFLNAKNAREFMAELWALLISAEDSADGIPAAILEQKKDDIKDRMNGYTEKLSPLTIVETENPKKYSNSVESEDTFEIVDLLESMSCEDIEKDYVMTDEEHYQTTTRNCHQEECVENSSAIKFLGISNGLENSQQTLKSDDFNPEEEWKQIYEMKHRIASFSAISSKLSEDKKNCEIQGTVSNYCSNTAKCYDKNSKHNTYLAIKEADSWLHGKSCRNEKLDKNYKLNKFLFCKESDSWLRNGSLDKDALNKENNFGKIYTEIHPGSSPAELIRQAFSSYFTKDSINNWLLCN